MIKIFFWLDKNKIEPDSNAVVVKQPDQTLSIIINSSTY